MTTTVARPAAMRPRPQVCRACGTLYDPTPVAICEQCLGPLDPVVDAARVLPTRDAIAARPWSLWRYREWLPFDGEPVLSLDTGGTPLVEAPRLAALLGVAHVWVKNDAVSHPSPSRIGSSRRRSMRPPHSGSTRSAARPLAIWQMPLRRRRHEPVSRRGSSFPKTSRRPRSSGPQCTARGWSACAVTTTT